LKVETMEFAKAMPIKEQNRRGAVANCLKTMPSKLKKDVDKTSLKAHPEIDPLLLKTSESICECMVRPMIEEAYKGLENKQALSKEEALQVERGFKESTKLPEVRRATRECLFSGASLLPLLTLTAYDSREVYLNECLPLFEEMTTVYRELPAGNSQAKKYAQSFCECSHPKLKSSETRAEVARVCHDEATRAVGKEFSVKGTSYRTLTQEEFKGQCSKTSGDVLRTKVEESNLRALKAESKERLLELALPSLCECVAPKQAEVIFKGLSEAEVLSPEEKKKFDEARVKFEKSYDKHKIYEECLDRALLKARASLSEELKGKPSSK
jgi:hypothetical protein